MLSLGLAVDSLQGWLFAAGGSWVQCSRLDGSHRKMVLNETSTVRDIALDTQVSAAQNDLSTCHTKVAVYLFIYFVSERSNSANFKNTIIQERIGHMIEFTCLVS